MIFFTDTNLFLQCRPIPELDWSLVSQDREITIFVTRPVIEEIDRLKSDGNRRRARKARVAYTYFGSMLKDGVSERIEKALPYTIKVVIASNPPISKLTNADGRLDLGKNDDRIISMMLHYLHAEKGRKASLLTYDIGPRITCHSLQLSFTDIPESWLLPPENDPRDKQILQLKETVNALQSRIPLLSAEVHISGTRVYADRSKNEKILITQYRQLSDEEIEGFIEGKKAQFPIHRYDDLGHALPIDDHDSEEVIKMKRKANRQREMEIEKAEKYNSVEYPKWLKELRKYYADYSAEKSAAYRC